MKVDILQIKTKVASLSAPPKDIPEDLNLPETEVVVEAQIHSTENNENDCREDVSTVSIEETVPDIHIEKNPDILASTDSSTLLSVSSN